MQVGFIGLGNMGAAMATRLLGAGHGLRAYNRTRSRGEPLERLGAQLTDSASAAASNVEVLISMLSDDEAVESLTWGSGRMLEALPGGAVHVSMSTISPALAQRLAPSHRERGQHFLSAPVFGRPEAARDGQLFVIAAGDEAQIERCQALFDVLGQRTFVAGSDPALANVIKLAGNFLISAMIESFAEAFAFTSKSGIDRERFLEILGSALFPTPMAQAYGRRIAKQQFEPVGFRMPLGLKDNRLLLQAAEQAEVPLPLASLLRDRFVTALATGLGAADWAAIASLSYRNAGL